MKKILENIYDLNINDVIEYFFGLANREDKMAFIHALSWNMEEALFLSAEARMRCELSILYLTYLVYKNDIQMAEDSESSSKCNIIDFTTRKLQDEVEDVESSGRCNILDLSTIELQDETEDAESSGKSNILDLSTRELLKEAKKGIRAVELCNAMYIEWYGQPYIDLSNKYLKLKR